MSSAKSRSTTWWSCRAKARRSCWRAAVCAAGGAAICGTVCGDGAAGGPGGETGEMDPGVLFGVGPRGPARRSSGFAEWRGDAAISEVHHEHHSEAQSLCLTADAPLDWARFHDWLGRLRLADGERLLRGQGVLNIAGAGGAVRVHRRQHNFSP